MAVGTLVFERSPYRNVVCLGHILDEEGRKMSKHLGNVLDPVPLMDAHGADAVRWFMLAAGSPVAGPPGRASGHRGGRPQDAADVLEHRVVPVAVRPRGGMVALGRRRRSERSALDRWVLSQAHAHGPRRDRGAGAVRHPAGGPGAGDVRRGAVELVRAPLPAPVLGRRPAALQTLHEALRLVTLAMAPFTPFITERVWQDLFAVVPGEPESVHLAPWPQVDDAADRRRPDRGRRRWCAGWSSSAGPPAPRSGVRNRQPLSACLVAGAALVGPAAGAARRDRRGAQRPAGARAGRARRGSRRRRVKANFRALGKRFGKSTPVVAAAVAGADAAWLVAAIRGRGPAVLEVDGVGPVELAEDDVIITETPREGWTVASDAGETVALDLHPDR